MSDSLRQLPKRPDDLAGLVEETALASVEGKPGFDRMTWRAIRMDNPQEDGSVEPLLNLLSGLEHS